MLYFFFSSGSALKVFNFLSTAHLMLKLMMQACEVRLSVPPEVKMEVAAFPLSLTDVVFRHSRGCVSLRTGGPHAH